MQFSQCSIFPAAPQNQEKKNFFYRILSQLPVKTYCGLWGRKPASTRAPGICDSQVFHSLKFSHSQPLAIHLGCLTLSFHWLMWHLAAGLAPRPWHLCTHQSPLFLVYKEEAWFASLQWLSWNSEYLANNASCICILHYAWQFIKLNLSSNKCLGPFSPHRCPSLLRFQVTWLACILKSLKD